MKERKKRVIELEGIKAVLWDLDDTLYSRVEAARATFPGMFRELLYPGRCEEYISQAVEYMMSRVRRWSMVSEDAFSELLLKYPSDRPYSREACLDYYYSHITDYAKPNDGAVRVMRELSGRGIKNAVVTNMYKERAPIQREKIEAIGIASLLDAVVISGEVGLRKPEREIYDLTARMLGVKNYECIFVGDDPDSDIKGALGAGMRAVWINTWGLTADFCGAVDEISSADELPGSFGFE